MTFSHRPKGCLSDENRQFELRVDTSDPAAQLSETLVTVDGEIDVTNRALKGATPLAPLTLIEIRRAGGIAPKGASLPGVRG